MRWFKVAAIAIGVMIAFLVVSSVIGFLIEAVIAVLAVAVVVLAVKLAFNRRRALGKRYNRELGGRRAGRSLRRPNTPDVDDDLARLKRETGA